MARALGRWRRRGLDVPEGIRRHGEAGLIARRAVERGVEVELTPRRFLVLRYGEREHRFKLGWSTLNHPLARTVTQQKDVTSRLLRAGGFAAPENAVFRAGDVDRGWAWAETILPVVVKPHAASKGKLVHVGLTDREAFTAAFETVGRDYEEVLVEAVVPGVEHRFAVVGGRVAAITERVPMHVVGDGTATVSELVATKNDERRRRANPIHRRLEVDDLVLATLQAQALDLNSRPAHGRTVWLRRTSNISVGGDAVDRTDDVARDHVRRVRQAAKVFPGLRLAGFDVMIAGDAMTVLEVNPSPMLSMHHYPWEGQARDVYNRVLDVMFPATAR